MTAGGAPPPARRPPDPEWPGGARLVVSLVVKVEEGAELSVSLGDERNEATYDIVEEVTGAPDPAKDSHFEYGARAGYWRVMDELDRHGFKAYMNFSARALTLSPWMGWDALARGHEIGCHSFRRDREALAGEHGPAGLVRSAGLTDRG